MEIIADDTRLKDLYDAGQGCIYNDFVGDHDTSASTDYNKLHRATCRFCDPRREGNAMTTETSGQKIFFESCSEALDWLRENRAGNFSKCLQCNP